VPSEAPLRRPSAFLPLLLSAAALALVLARVVLHGTAPGRDEDAWARLFQLLLIAQVPIVAFHALRHLPRDGRAALGVLALQLLAALAALAPVAILGL
jgi:hypothetical protein